MELGSVIREMRARRGISQRELARRAGIEYGNMCRYESGAVMPGLEALAKIATGLGTEGSTLLAQVEGRTAA